MFSAPAEDIIEFVPVRFSIGIGKQSTVYQGEPSDVVDKAWEDLYNSKLLFPHSSAVMMLTH